MCCCYRQRLRVGTQLVSVEARSYLLCDTRLLVTAMRYNLGLRRCAFDDSRARLTRQERLSENLLLYLTSRRKADVGLCASPLYRQGLADRDATDDRKSNACSVFTEPSSTKWEFKHDVPGSGHLRISDIHLSWFFGGIPHSYAACACGQSKACGSSSARLVAAVVSPGRNSGCSSTAH